MTTVYAAMRNALLVARGDGWEAPERLFVGTFKDGLLRSTDGGESFERVGRSIDSDRVMSATVSPHGPDEPRARLDRATRVRPGSSRSGRVASGCLKHPANTRKLRHG